jgi:hypothetical protein
VASTRKVEIGLSWAHPADLMQGMIGQTVSAGDTTAIPVPGIVQFSRRNYLRADCRVVFQVSLLHRPTAHRTVSPLTPAQYRTRGLLMARRIIEPRGCYRTVQATGPKNSPTDSKRAAHGSPGARDQTGGMKRNRRDSSETVGRDRSAQPRRSKRIKEHEVGLVEPGFKDAQSATR